MHVSLATKTREFPYRERQGGAGPRGAVKRDRTHDDMGRQSAEGEAPLACTAVAMRV